MLCDIDIDIFWQLYDSLEYTLTSWHAILTASSIEEENFTREP